MSLQINRIFSAELRSLSTPMVSMPMPPRASMLVRIAAMVTAMIFTRIECIALPPVGCGQARARAARASLESHPMSNIII